MDRVKFIMRKRGKRVIETTLERKKDGIYGSYIFNEKLFAEIMEMGRVVDNKKFKSRYEDFEYGIFMIKDTTDRKSNLKHSDFNEKKGFLRDIYEDTAKMLGLDYNYFTERC